MDPPASIWSASHQRPARVPRSVKDSKRRSLTQVVKHHGASLNILDPQQERDPPAPATPVTFPDLSTQQSPPSTECLPRKLRPLFSQILRPTDVSDSHLEALNIKVVNACSLADLLPLDVDSYLPPASAVQADSTGSYADATKTDPILAKRRKDFDDRLAELRIENDMGYRIINRVTKPADNPPRLAYLRKFWEGLEGMSPYWDTSLDQYYEAPTPSLTVPESFDKGFKRQRLDSVQPNDLTMPDLDCASGVNIGMPDMKLEDVQAVASQTPLPDERTTRSTSATPEPRSCLRYKGRRTATGRDMPDQFRIDTIKAFVESVIWSFHFAIAVPRQMPIVQINGLNLPVRQTAAVYRVPSERVKARSGFLVGPAIAIQVRPETDFDAKGMSDQQRVAKARLDQMRELGALLQCAQERGRQGKTETRPGEGQWWTEKPRWGGCSGGEVESQEGNGDTQAKNISQMAEEMVSGGRERLIRPRRQKKTPVMLWKEIRCGSKQWDPKTEYEAIGKDPRSSYDEVFMVSSLNHHLSILKLTVHSAYTEYIRTEKMPEPLPKETDWWSPTLQRTQWYDLFSIEERVQAFTALWSITTHLTRELSEPAASDQDGGKPKDS